MKFSVLLIFILCLAETSFSATNSIGVNVNGGMNYTCNSASTLENDQTLANIFTINILNQSNNASIYVKISAWNYPAGWNPINYYPLTAVWTSDTSPNATNIASSLTITTNDGLLFKQPKMTGNTAYAFKYNLVLDALGYTDYIPGNYNFTLMFTMTEP